LREDHLVTEALEHLDHGPPRRREQRVVEAGDEQRDAHQRAYAAVTPSASISSSGALSPKRVEHRDVVGAHSWVGGHQRESTVSRLRDEQSIERIAVVERQGCDGKPIVWGQRKAADTCADYGCVQVGGPGGT